MEEASFPYQDEFGYGTKVLRNEAKTRGTILSLDSS